MIKTNKQIAMVLFAFGFGFGSLFASWFITTQNDEQYTALEERVDKVSANLVGFETAFKTLSAEIRQLHVIVSDNAKIHSHDQSIQALNQFSAVNTEDTEPSKDDDSPSYNNMMHTTVDIPSDQEMASITLIVDKLRARDMNAYPDFPSLMTSPEIAVLGPAALDKMMAEVARMFEDGEIDPSFFPKK